MRKKDLEATESLKRVAALPYNDYFMNEITRIRNKYGIQTDISTKAKEDILHNITYISPTAYTPFSSEMSPLTIDIIESLLKPFRLPAEAFDGILRFLLTNDREWLSELEPHLYFRKYTVGQKHNLAVTIELNSYITKKKWQDIWTHYIRDFSRRELGQLARKRSTLKSFAVQMKVYHEWYQLARVQGLSLEETADRWQEEHPEMVDPYKGLDASTISKAVSEFERTITPMIDD